MTQRGVRLRNITISARYEDGSRPDSLALTIIPGKGGVARDFRVAGHAVPIPKEALPLRFVRLAPNRRGFWTACAFEVRDDLDVTFQPLPREGPIGWWHELHGAADGDLQRGRGIRIGVVDEALERQSDPSCIRHVVNLGLLPATGQDDARGYLPRVSHGQAVTSLVASHASDRNGYQGMAPGAAVYFAAAGSPTSERLSSARVANAITALAVEHGCDLITVSAGDFPSPLPDVHAAVQDAWDTGVLCFFASGNRVDAGILFPARYDECLSVAALGRRAFAPPGTMEHHEDVTSTQGITGDFYVWKDSALDGMADFIAAGSNVIWSTEHTVDRAVNGTSFASPVAAGIAAVILSGDERYGRMGRDRARAQYALDLIATRSVRVAPSEETQAGRSGVRYGIIGAMGAAPE